MGLAYSWFALTPPPSPPRNHRALTTAARSKLARGLRELIERTTSTIYRAAAQLEAVEVEAGGGDISSMRVLGVLMGLGLKPSGGDAAIVAAAVADGGEEGQLWSWWKDPSAADVSKAFDELLGADDFVLRTPDAISARFATAVILVLVAAIKPKDKDKSMGAAATAAQPAVAGERHIERLDWHVPKSLKSSVPHVVEHALSMFGASHKECFGNIAVPAEAPARSSMHLSHLVAIVDQVRRLECLGLHLP